MVGNTALFLYALLLAYCQIGFSAGKANADSVCNQEVGRALLTIAKDNPIALNGSKKKINMAKTYNDIAESDIKSSQNLATELFTLRWTGHGKDKKYFLVYNPSVCSDLKLPATLSKLKSTIDTSVLKN